MSQIESLPIQESVKYIKAGLDSYRVLCEDHLSLMFQWSGFSDDQMFSQEVFGFMYCQHLYFSLEIIVIFAEEILPFQNNLW